MNWIIDKEIGIETITRLPNHDLREKIPKYSYHNIIKFSLYPKTL